MLNLFLNIYITTSFHLLYCLFILHTLSFSFVIFNFIIYYSRINSSFRLVLITFSLLKYNYRLNLFLNIYICIYILLPIMFTIRNLIIEPSVKFCSIYFSIYSRCIEEYYFWKLSIKINYIKKTHSFLSKIFITFTTLIKTIIFLSYIKGIFKFIFLNREIFNFFFLGGSLVRYTDFKKKRILQLKKKKKNLNKKKNGCIS